MSSPDEVISISSGDDSSVEVLGTGQGDLPNYVSERRKVTLGDEECELTAVIPSPFALRVTENSSLVPKTKSERERLQRRKKQSTPIGQASRSQANINGFFSPKNKKTQQGQNRMTNAAHPMKGDPARLQPPIEIEISVRPGVVNTITASSSTPSTSDSSSASSVDEREGKRYGGMKASGTVVIKSRPESKTNGQKRRAQSGLSRRDRNGGCDEDEQSSSSDSATNVSKAAEKKRKWRRDSKSTTADESSSNSSSEEYAVRDSDWDEESSHNEPVATSSRSAIAPAAEPQTPPLVKSSMHPVTQVDHPPTASLGVESPVANDDEFAIKPLSLKQFNELWQKAEDNIGMGTEEVESSVLVKKSDKVMDRSDTTEQQTAQYGRILPGATDHLLRNILQVKMDEIFVDIGHGLGNTVLQASYTIGCKSRGIEVCKDRNALAIVYQQDCWKEESLHVGPSELRHGRLEVKEHRDFLTGRVKVKEHRDFLTSPGQKVVKMFCNNYNGVFKHRSCKNSQTVTLDDYISGLFSQLREGSKLVTLDQMNFAVGTLQDMNDEREKHGMRRDANASYYTMETVELGKQNECVSWSKNGGKSDALPVYVYTRVGTPNFLCANPNCNHAENSEYIPSVEILKEGDEDGERMLPRSCLCGWTFRPKRSKAKTQI